MKKFYLPHFFTLLTSRSPSLLNPTRNLRTLTATAALATLPLTAPAAITWVSTGTTAYPSGSSLALTATSPGKYAGIGLDFSSNIGGTFVNNGVGNGQLCFTTTSAISAGSPIELFFDFSDMLGSTPLPNNTRSAAKFRLNNGTSVQVDTQMYGGMQTLQTYWGTPNNGSLTSHTNPGDLQFQDVFMRDPSSHSSVWFGQGATSAVFRGFVDPNTARITGGDDDSSLVSIDGTGTTDTPGDTINGDDHTLFDIVDPDRGSTGLTFSSWRFTVTPNETLAAGSKFLFTFEGERVADAIAPPAIPEPSRALFLALGALSLLFPRRRK